MHDIRWHLEQDADDAPAYEPLTVDYVRDYHLRSPNGNAEDSYIETLIRVARRAAERVTRRALVPQTWRLVMSGFPCGGPIVVPKPPLQSVTAITYIDEDGVEQTWGGSPLPYEVVAPSGPQARYGLIAPAYEQVWPTTRRQLEAVTVEFIAGYPETGSPAEAQIPEDITHGMLLMIGELYKQRSESVHAFNQNPALIRARDLWLGYQVY
jgi:uncharacterized phiE125 gp8 family phage protein